MRWSFLLVLCVGCDCAESHELDASRDANVDAPAVDAGRDASIPDAPIRDAAIDCPPSAVVRACDTPDEPCVVNCICGTRPLLEVCGIDDVGSCVRERSFCDALEAREWLSVDELECGLGPMGVELCSWRISFLGGRFDWSYSDVAESGTYTCMDDRVTSDRAEGMWDFPTQTLVWDGVAYRPSPEACPD